MDINNALLSVGISAIVVVLLRIAPIGKTPSALSVSATSSLRSLEGRYAEVQGLYETLRDDYEGKLVDYTNAYHDWTRREKEYQFRIQMLEAEVDQLRSRIRDLESRAGVSRENLDRLIVVGVWPNNSLDIQGERDALYNAGFEYRGLDGNKATKTGIISELDSHADRPIIVEVGAHGTTEGTQLHDSIAKPGWWRRVLAGRDIKMVALLSCDSDDIARVLRDDGISTISAQGEVVDSDTVTFVAALYRNLSRGDDIPDAVDNARLHVSQDAWEMIRLWEAK